MFFRKKPTETTQSAPPPPWENIDNTSTKHVSTARFRFNLTEFVSQVTGFGKWGTRFFLFGFAISLGFVAYIVYVTMHEPLSLPPSLNRSAMDARATSSQQVLPPPYQP